MPTADQQAVTRRVADAVSPSVVRVGRHGGRGCGVVVGEGLVVTNAHNLRDRTTLVTFADGRAVQGRATGIDQDGDLTVLAVDTADVPSLGWSDAAAELGMTVYAVAAIPGGRRVTSGAVSSVDRAFRGPRGRLVTGGIEFTAPLARGSTGGPVVDEQGRLIGITTLRLGDGFAIAQAASAGLRARIDDLAAGREPVRVVLGVGIAPAPVARRLRSAVGLADRDGALVRGVADGSPAADAGIARGDLIVAVGDTPVADPSDLESALAAVHPGDVVTVQLVRGSDELSVTVRFAAEPSDAAPSDAEPQDAEPGDTEPG
jgi:S1-C subfamily serine protease